MRITICLLLIFGWIFNISAFAQESVTDTPKKMPDAQQQVVGDNQSAMTDIYDIKGPEAFGVNPAYFRYTLYALLIFLIFALVVAGIIFIKKRKKKIEEIIAQVDPDAAAYKQLEQLAGLQNPDGKEFYFRLSAILRHYIRCRFNIDAPEMTTEELLPKISEIRLGHDIHQQAKTFFYSSDPVKFADIAVYQEKMKDDLLFVRNFVKETTPVKPDHP